MATELFDPYTEPCEVCAPHVKAKEGVCATEKTIEKIADFIQTEADEPAKIIEEAKEKLNCDNEACILENRSFLETLNNGEIREIDKELKERYIVPGPEDSTALLSNFNIDDTLELWKNRFTTFMHIPFQFINFADYSSPLQELNIGKAYAAGFRTVGCVLNTDFRGGPGKHWICVFIDMRGPTWTIELFNSSGNPPTIEVVRWMAKMEKEMKEFIDKNKLRVDVKQIVVSKIIHQKSKTECGMYVLYFLWNRLKGKSYQLFSYEPIPDARVTKFRKHVFR